MRAIHRSGVSLGRRSVTGVDKPGFGARTPSDKALSVAFCRTVAEPGRYCDGDKLYTHLERSETRYGSAARHPRARPALGVVRAAAAAGHSPPTTTRQPQVCRRDSDPLRAPLLEMIATAVKSAGPSGRAPLTGPTAREQPVPSEMGLLNQVRVRVRLIAGVSKGWGSSVRVAHTRGGRGWASTRQYARHALGPVEVSERAMSRSAVSRRFVALSTVQTGLFVSRPLGEPVLRSVCMDGKVFKEHCIVIALGSTQRGANTSSGCGKLRSSAGGLDGAAQRLGDMLVLAGDVLGVALAAIATPLLGSLLFEIDGSTP